ncbi:MAG: FAD binding domain-containing protein [Thermoplasmata archaeon]
MDGPSELLTPSTPREAIAALGASPPGETVVLAGGTDLALDLGAGRLRPRRLLSLRRLPWRFLEWSPEGSLRIGSTLPLRAVELDRRVVERHPGLVEAIRAVGGVALRHRATLGGNIVRSSPSSDLLPILLALDAEVDLTGPQGDRRVDLGGLLDRSRSPRMAAAELVRSVGIPEPRPSAYLWQRIRPVNDISQVGVAVARSPRDGRWRIAVGSILPGPRRIPEAEAALGTGADPGPERVGQAAEAVAGSGPFAGDRRGSDAYRQRLVRVLIRRAIDRVRLLPAPLVRSEVPP